MLLTFGQLDSADADDDDRFPSERNYSAAKNQKPRFGLAKAINLLLSPFPPKQSPQCPLPPPTTQPLAASASPSLPFPHPSLLPPHPSSTMGSGSRPPAHANSRFVNTTVLDRRVGLFISARAFVKATHVTMCSAFYVACLYCIYYMYVYMYNIHSRSALSDTLSPPPPLPPSSSRHFSMRNAHFAIDACSVSACGRCVM